MQLTVKHFTQLTAEELYEILRARSAVFVVEQNCAYQDMDGADTLAYHLWLSDETGLLAYVRVVPAGVVHEDVTIGRVISLRRRCGLASRLLEEGVRVAKENFGARKIHIGAQTYARPLYEKAGFSQCGEPYLEDGIPHIPMSRNVAE